MLKMLRCLELLLLFVAAPVALAVLLPPGALYPVLAGGAIVGAVLLHFTAGFRWQNLLGPVRLWPAVGLGVITFAVTSGLCWAVLPERLWYIPIHLPYMMVVLAIFYPLVLVLPQELMYRALFFERYGFLFSNQKTAVFANAVLFSLAHLLYWSWTVLIITFIGSFLFSSAYLRPKGFVQVIVLHSVAGVALFASGLGWLFYSGGAVSQ